MNARTKGIAVSLLLMLHGGLASGDMLVVKKLRYRGIRVVGVQKAQVVFQVGARKLTKPLVDVTAISIDGKKDFNDAEELQATGKIDEAVAAYDSAIKAESGWMEKLIKYRRLAALNRSDKIDRAAREWLTVVDGSEVAADALKIRPRKFAPKGAPANGRAIALLEARLKRIKDNAEYQAAVRNLLLDLYQWEGRRERAAELAGKIAGDGQAKVSPAKNTVRSPGPVAGRRLPALGILIEQGKAEQVLQEVKANLRGGRYKTEELAAAILLAGRAEQQLASHAKGMERRKLLIAAGLDYMRVATFFATAAQAPEALLGAGQVNAALGNALAASNAFEMVIQRYADSGAAKKAAAALKELKEKPK